jgi:hypothetical protein
MNLSQTVLAGTGVGCRCRVIGRRLEGVAFPRRMAFGDAGRVLRVPIGRRVVLLVDELIDLERVVRVTRLV